MVKNFYSVSFVFALLIHLGLMGFLFFSNDNPVVVAQMPSKEPVKTIDAVAINSSELEKEIARLDSMEQEKLRKEKQKQLDLEKKHQELARKAKQEKQRLDKIRAEKQRLAELAKKEAEQLKIVEEARLKKLHQEKEELEKLKREKALALKQKEEAQEQKRLAELEYQKELEERKQAELERKKEEKLAAQKREEERQRKLAQEKKRLEQEELERKARAARVTQDQIAQYAAVIKAKIDQNWRLPLGIDVKGKECVVRVQTSDSGEVLGVVITNSSGDVEFDRSTELAVMKSSPLPMPPDQAARQEFKSFKFTFNPEGV